MKTHHGDVLLNPCTTPSHLPPLVPKSPPGAAGYNELCQFSSQHHCGVPNDQRGLGWPKLAPTWQESARLRGSPAHTMLGVMEPG